MEGNANDFVNYVVWASCLARRLAQQVALVCGGLKVRHSWDSRKHFTASQRMFLVSWLLSLRGSAIVAELGMNLELNETIPRKLELPKLRVRFLCLMTFFKFLVWASWTFPCTTKSPAMLKTHCKIIMSRLFSQARCEFICGFPLLRHHLPKKYWHSPVLKRQSSLLTLSYIIVFQALEQKPLGLWSC
jgi:hypothetical protein